MEGFSGFSCTWCHKLFSWDLLKIWHELNSCPKCESEMLTKEKRQKEARNVRPEPEPETYLKECDFDKPDKYPKVVKKRSAKKH